MSDGAETGKPSPGASTLPVRTRLSIIVDIIADGWAGPFPASLVLLGAFFLAQVLITTLIVHWAGTGVGIDDSEQLSYMSFLWAGYGGSQPPIYTWLNILSASFFGTNVFSLRLVKYAMMFVAVFSVYAAMRSMGYSRSSASAAAFGLLLAPQVLWSLQQTLSHSVAAVSLSALAVLAFVELQRRRTPAAYAAFGLAAAAMLLAKYNDAILLAAMLFAALSLRETRGTIFSRLFLISILVATLGLAPTIIWNFTHSDDLVARFHKFGVGGGWTIAAAGIGSWELLVAFVSCAVLPACVFLVAASDLRRTRPIQSRPGLFWTKYLWRALLFALVLALVLVVGAGATTVRDRWMLPVLPLFVLAMSASLDAYGKHARKAFGIVVGVGVAAVALTAPGIWWIQVHGGHHLGRTRQLDYHALYREITRDGPVATVTSDRNWIGSLRLVDPALRTLYVEFPEFESLIKEPAVMVSLEDDRPSEFLLLLIKTGGYQLEPEGTRVNIPEPFGPEPHYRVATITKLKKIAP